MDDVPTHHHPALVHRGKSLTAIGIMRLRGYALMLALLDLPKRRGHASGGRVQDHASHIGST